MILQFDVNGSFYSNAFQMILKYLSQMRSPTWWIWEMKKQNVVTQIDVFKWVFQIPYAK